ncbi:MAG: N-acetylmuramoyl-L-alanine amidase [Limnochordaceae bacterium]|nr:N-acetylmuramoyl-L-alanine amidase [Limnochordaceae bacterium]
MLFLPGVKRVRVSRVRIWVIPARWVYSPLLALFVAVAIWSGTRPAEPEVARLLANGQQTLQHRAIGVDAGHGGPDPGASADGAVEKQIVLDIALRLEKLLQQVGARPYLTRRMDDRFVDDLPIPLDKVKGLDHRAELINQTEAEVFLSVHANSFPSPRWSGAQVFYQSGSAEGKRLAEAIQTELVRLLGPNQRRALGGDFRVLRQSKVPAVIVEVGFLSNPEERARLQDPEYRQRVAEAILAGLIRYYRGILSPPAAGQLR